MLRDWYRIARPAVWLFPGRDPILPLTTRQLARTVHAAANMAGIKKRVTPHTLRHSSGSRIIPATDVRCGYFLGDRTIWGVLMAA
jgi:integrase/recombinase XerD